MEEYIVCKAYTAARATQKQKQKHKRPMGLDAQLKLVLLHVLNTYLLYGIVVAEDQAKWTGLVMIVGYAPRGAEQL